MGNWIWGSACKEWGRRAKLNFLFSILSEQPELVLTRFDSDDQAARYIELLLNSWDDSKIVQLLDQDPAEVERCEQAAKDVQTKPTENEQKQLKEEISKLNLPPSLFNMPPVENPYYKSMGNMTIVSSLLASEGSRQQRKVIYTLHADPLNSTPTRREENLMEQLT